MAQRPRAVLLLLVVVLALGSGCVSEETDRETATWRIEETPLISVGDRAGADSQFLATVSDARLLASDGIAIADAGANRVLFFDAAGREVSRVGRRGRGPGEFVGQLTLVEAPGDSVAVWDPRQRRWTLVDSRSGGFRDAADSIRAPTLLHAGIQVQSDLDEPPAWVPRLLSGLAAGAADVRMGHLDEGGLLWISHDHAQRDWRVYADSGAAFAQLMLPPDLRALHFQRGALVGIASDSAGLEQVVVHRIAMGDVPAVDRTPAARAALQSAMRMSVVAQEANYAMKGGYTPFTDSLTVTMPEGTRFKILSADARGWSGAAWYVESGYTCAMLIGLPVPPGWTEGAPRCGW